MAMGDNYSNNNGGNNSSRYAIEIRSNIKMNNRNSVVDKTALLPSFWNHMLKLSIAPMKIGDDGSISYDKDNTICVFLNVQSATVFLHEIEQFLRDREAGTIEKNYGVPSGNGVIYIADGKQYGSKFPCIVIEKIDPDSKQSIASACYEIRGNFFYGIRNFNGDDFKFDKKMYDDLEIENIMVLLKNYISSMSGAVAYTVMEANNYNNYSSYKVLTSIADKLGVEYKSSKNKTRNYAFSNNSGNTVGEDKSSTQFADASYDEIDDM